MLRNAMMAALGTAAAGTTEENGLEEHRSTHVDDRSQKERSVDVNKNLPIFVAQQQQQLVQCNGQLLGREHAQGQESSTMLHDDVDDSIDDIENDDDSNIYQQHDHRLNAAHFRAAVLDEEDGSEGANKRPQKAEIHRFWTRKNSYAKRTKHRPSNLARVAHPNSSLHVL